MPPSMTAFGPILVLCAVVGGAEPQPTTTAAPDTTPAAATTAANAAAPDKTPAATTAPNGPTRGDVGVGLIAAGAGLATSSVVALTLLESVTTPDRENQPVSASQETLRSVGGFASATAAGVSVVAMVVGGGLVISASLDARGPSSSSPAE